MNEETLRIVTDEIAKALVGQRCGKIYTLGRLRFAIDFRIRTSVFLFISVEPRAPRIYLIRRRTRDLEKASAPESVFGSLVRKRLSHSVVRAVEKLADERIVTILLGPEGGGRLIIQLTGRSSNLFLTDPDGAILASARKTHGQGQKVGDVYSPPARSEAQRSGADPGISFEGFETISEALDSFFQDKERERAFLSQAAAARSEIKKRLAKQTRLRETLDRDLKKHGDADHWKRLGDLALANISTARRVGNRLFLTDYFDDQMPVIEIELDSGIPLTEAAEIFFKKYSKAGRAKAAITARLATIDAEIEKLRRERNRLESAIEEGDLAEFAPPSKAVKTHRKKGVDNSRAKKYAGVRRFLSSDGFEILVGKRSKDNDHLTFRIANSLDTWMHAADYPGSHVVIRNPARTEIPHSTLLEAARLAAFYSKARAETKAAVHHTLKKYVHKPRGAKPGLASLASFKTILVVPGFPKTVKAADSRGRN